MSTVMSLAKRRSHWIGEDGKCHSVEWQGKSLKWTVHTIKTQAPQDAKRGAVISFSQASRFRCLDLFNRIDYERSSPGLFITLTYPDETERMESRSFTQDRSVFWRYMEKHLSRHVCAFWRIEYQERKSGKNLGQVFPHFHFLVFKTQYISHSAVNDLWKRTIGVAGYVRTETKRMENERQAGAYLSTYIGKKASSSLVIAAYLNNHPGRQWGVLRRSLLPLHPKKEGRFAMTERMESAYRMAMQMRPEIHSFGNQSFTMFGKCAAILANEIFGQDVDDNGKP